MNFKKTIAGIMALAMLNCSLSATGVDFDFTQLQKVSASDSYSIDDFQIDENGVLVKYVGHANNVSIPSNVTYIGDEAFMGCTDLRTVKIPGSVKTIGECAFTVCSNLKTITLESGIESSKVVPSLRAELIFILPFIFSIELLTMSMPIPRPEISVADSDVENPAA